MKSWRDFSPDNLIHIHCRKYRKLRYTKEHTSTYGLITQRNQFVYILGFMYGKGKEEEICCNPSEFICFKLWYFFLASEAGTGGSQEEVRTVEPEQRCQNQFSKARR